MAKIYWRLTETSPVQEKELGYQTMIGRSQDNDIYLLDRLLSRHHAKIVFENDTYVLRDLDSRNGTLLNGAPVAEDVLKPGDEITIGSAVLRFDRPFAAPSAPPEEPAPEPSSDRASPYLLMTKGPEKDKTYPLTGDGLSAGRQESNDIELDDFRISGRHLLIQKTPDGAWEVEDLNSKNGTFVNREKITRKTLEHGDVIIVGGVQLQFLLPGREPPPVPSQPREEPAAADNRPETISLKEIPESTPTGRLVSILSLVLIFGAIIIAGYGAIQQLETISSREIQSSGNLLASSSSTDDKATIFPWKERTNAVMTKTDGGERSKQSAVRLRRKSSDSPLPALAQFNQPVEVVSGHVYELNGSLKVKGEGACCLAVKWIKKYDPSLFDIDYGEVCRGGAHGMFNSFFRCPRHVEKAEVFLVVFGDGEGTFDKVQFVDRDLLSLPEDGDVGNAALLQRIERGDLTLELKRNGPFDLAVGSAVAMNEKVLRNVRLQIGASVQGVPGEALGIGSRIVEYPNSVVMGRNMFIPESNSWITIQKRIELSGTKGRVVWEIPHAAGDRGLGMEFVLGLPGDLLGGRKRFVVYNAFEKRPVALKELSGLKVQELVIGGLPGGSGSRDRTQLVVTFPADCTIVRRGEEIVAKIEKEIAVKREREKSTVTLLWSFASRIEAARMEQVFERAEEAAASGREGTAVALLQKILADFRPEEAYRKKIGQRLERYRAAGEVLLQQAELMERKLAGGGDRAAVSALLLFLNDIKERFTGCTEMETQVDAFIGRVSTQEQVANTTQRTAGVESAFALAREYFGKQDYGTAYLLTEKLLEDHGEGTVTLDEKLHRDLVDFLDMVQLRLMSKKYLPPLQLTTTGEKEVRE